MRSKRCDSRSRSWDGVAMSESCREWRGDLAAAALGNIEPGAQIALQAHVDGCRACRAELGEQVLGRLSWERANERHRRRRRFSVAIATAVAAVAAIVVVFVMAASL